jgi:RimJ/RimL family protein N-acetyltransferase
MIKGRRVSLRPVREADLEELHVRLTDVEARGPWYPPRPPKSSADERSRRQDSAWYHRGKWHDIDVYTLTRAESNDRRATDESPR